MNIIDPEFRTWAKTELESVDRQRAELKAKIDQFLARANMLMGSLNGRYDLLKELLGEPELPHAD